MAVENPGVLAETIGWFRMNGRPVGFSEAKFAYSSKRPTPNPKSTVGMAVWSWLMICGKAARTIGLLAVKLPVSSKRRNTSTMFEIDPLPGRVRLTVWCWVSPLASELVMLVGVTLPTAGLLTPLGQR